MNSRRVRQAHQTGDQQHRRLYSLGKRTQKLSSSHQAGRAASIPTAKSDPGCAQVQVHGRGLMYRRRWPLCFHGQETGQVLRASARAALPVVPCGTRPLGIDGLAALEAELRSRALGNEPRAADTGASVPFLRCLPAPTHPEPTMYALTDTRPFLPAPRSEQKSQVP